MAQSFVLLPYHLDSPFPLLNPLRANDWVLWTVQTSVVCTTALLSSLSRNVPVRPLLLCTGNEQQTSQVPIISVISSCRGLRPRQPPDILFSPMTNNGVTAFPIYGLGRLTGNIFCFEAGYLYLRYGRTSPFLWLRTQHHYCIRRVPYCPVG